MTTTPLPASLAELLTQRLQKPQRHRLLQGFPAAPLMGTAVAPTTPANPNASFGHAEIPIRRLDGSVWDNRHATARHWLEYDARHPLTPLAELQLAIDEAARTDAPKKKTTAQLLREEKDHARRAVTRTQMQALLSEADQTAPAAIDVDKTRKLIVGVIPHTQCTPRKEGCGFCTFPHDKANPSLRKQTTDSVAEEMRHVLGRERDHLNGRAVSAIYFGGGTANLADASELSMLFDALVDGGLDVSDAEFSLEGVPALFTSFLNTPLKNLERMKVRRKRISMGVQTFERSFIEQMGRQAFGDHALIAKVIKKCRSMNIGVSGDFLFNLPGQTLAQMAADVDKAVALGFDQICLYNLVLYKGLGTLWSNDPALVAQMPNNELGCERWLTLREQLLRAGYVQTTLTNFERADVAAPDRFQYELLGFSPEDTDLIGFGPLSISLLCDWKQQRAIKLLRRKDLRQPPWSGNDLMHLYAPRDLRVLVVTRGMAKLGLERDLYKKLFSTDVVNDFPDATQLLLKAGLIDVDDAEVCLTPRGMFYSDTVVSLFAAEGKDDVAGVGMSTATLLNEPVQPGDHFVGMG